MAWMLFQHVVVSAVLAVVVAVANRVFRLSPAARHALWLVVLIKVLVPTPIEWPWGVPVPGAEQVAISAPVPSPRAIGPTTVIPPLPMEESAVTQSQPRTCGVAPRSALPGYGTIALAGWALLSGSALAFHASRYIRFARRGTVSLETPPWLRQLAECVSTSMQMRMPEIHVVDDLASPYVYGVRRTVLVVPAALLQAIPQSRWGCILAHEFAHLKWRDHLVRWVELFAGSIWFWNPVYWIARRALHANAELACDTWVVNALPDQRRAYAETLIDVSELIARSDMPIAALGMGAHGVRLDFERRLAMIMHGNETQRATWKTAIVAVHRSSSTGPHRRCHSRRQMIRCPPRRPILNSIGSLNGRTAPIVWKSPQC